MICKLAVGLDLSERILVQKVEILKDRKMPMAA
jgi:hypothetical protein